MRNSAIYTGDVTHIRWQPVRHRLRYRALYLLLDLDELPELTATLRLLSLRRLSLFGFLARDHGNGTDEPLRPQIEAHLRAAGIEPNGGAIKILCMPRILGTVFNPITVYYCHRADSSLAAVLYEVNNTFGERHSYLIPIAPDVPREGRVIYRHCSRKEFYVSPFMDMAMTYDFRLTTPDDRIALVIGAHDASGAILTASFAGKRTPLTDGNLWRVFLRFPLLAIQVLGAIHWEALKLWRKGMRLRIRPSPPSEPVTLALRPEGK